MEGCSKSAYDSYNQAMGVISCVKKIGNVKHPKSRLPQRAYKCQYCGKWHITSRKAKKSKKIWR